MQTGELLARAIFAIRKGFVTFNIFITDLKLAKVISDTGLNPEELVLVKQDFEHAKKAEKIGNAIFDNTKAFHENLKCCQNHCQFTSQPKHFYIWLSKFTKQIKRTARHCPRQYFKSHNNRQRKSRKH